MISDYEKYCPSGTPITIPYMEVYRTDELSYKDYESPLNTYGQSTTTTSSDSSSGDTTGDTSSSSGSSSSSSSSSSTTTEYKSNPTGTASASKAKAQQKAKTQKLYTKLSTAVQKYFKSGVNVNTLVNRYRNCAGSQTCIYAVTKKSKVWLKKGYYVETVSSAIYTIIKNN